MNYANYDQPGLEHSPSFYDTIKALFLMIISKKLFYYRTKYRHEHKVGANAGTLPEAELFFLLFVNIPIVNGHTLML